MQAFIDEAFRGDPLNRGEFSGLWKKLVVGMLDISDREGRASVKVLRHADEKFAKAREEGLMLEILSHKLLTKEERGCEVLQAAEHGVGQLLVDVVLDISRNSGNKGRASPARGTL